MGRIGASRAAMMFDFMTVVTLFLSVSSAKQSAPLTEQITFTEGWNYAD